MPTYKKKVNFSDTIQGLEIEEELRNLDQNKLYNTEATYSANSSLYPNNIIPFVDKHMAYLTSHPSVDPDLYMANLRLMTRIR